MKKLLSLLLCYVFLQAETFALRGGPGGSGNSKKLTGSYSGVITQANGGSGVGLFLLTAQSAGASNGSIVFFAQTGTTTQAPGPIGFGTASSAGGRYYAGTVTGLSNPSNGTFSGLFNATAQVSTTVGAVAVISTLSLAGTLTLDVTSAATNANNQQITGTASAQSSSGTVQKYTVSGWQTSADAVANGFGQVSGG